MNNTSSNSPGNFPGKSPGIGPRASSEEELLRQLFGYDNFRKFLQDYFAARKRLHPHFSHRYFAQKAGFKSSSFAAHVMEGKRTLTESALQKMIGGLGLNEEQARFFTCLVRYNQADDMREKERHYRELKFLRQQSPHTQVQKAQWAYYDNWYYSVVRELACYSNWGGDFKKLAKMVQPCITASEARDTVRKLVTLGLLTKRSNDTYAQSSPSLTARGVPGDILNGTRKQFILRGMEAIDAFDPDERHVSNLTLAISEKSYQEFRCELDALRRRFLDNAVLDPEVERVVQINFQAFPMSTVWKKDGAGGDADGSDEDEGNDVAGDADGDVEGLTSGGAA